jgi:membrane-bound metal-dependent hydrolase YbcI (DUF457 family)
MNELFHFFTGYLIVLWARNRMDPSHEKTTRHPASGVLTFCGGMAGLIPDIYEFLYPVMGHATWTHTIIGTVGLSLVFGILMWLLIKQYLPASQQKFAWVVGILILAAFSHLFLDIFTHTKFRCEEAVASFTHIYFWPIWDISFHLDCLFGWSYGVRVLIEWSVYLPLLFGTLLWRWKNRGEHPLAVFNWKTWAEFSTPGKKIPLYIVILFNYGIIISYIVSYFI